MARTIRESIEDNLTAGLKARIAKLTKISAPIQLITSAQAKLDAGDLAAKVGHIKDYGGRTYTAVEGKKYRRGAGATFTTEAGPVFFIPGPYSHFLTITEK